MYDVTAHEVVLDLHAESDSGYFMARRSVVTAVATRKPTLEDVARSAEVSYQTVSRVINQHPSVADGTRARVQRAIAELGYRPNRAARSLVTRRSNNIGIVSFGSRYYGPTQMLVHIEAASRARGYGLTFTSVDGHTLPEMSRAIGDLIGQNLDGIVMIAPIAEVDPAQIVHLCGATPFLMIDIDPSHGVHSVAIDQAHGARLATQHLIGLGHRQVCEISGPFQWHDARLRHETWLATLQASGIEPGPCIESDWTAAGGYAAAQRLLGAGVDFTALFAGNDQMALGAIRALRDAGLRVPEDVSIVGFDDVPEAAYFDPPLTTVHQDFVALGNEAVDGLTNLIESPTAVPYQRVLYPSFVVRASTAKVAAED
jgi:DNA-binding LacI/PurR family transcriptional regulator